MRKSRVRVDVVTGRIESVLAMRMSSRASASGWYYYATRDIRTTGCCATTRIKSTTKLYCLGSQRPSCHTDGVTKTRCTVASCSSGLPTRVRPGRRRCPEYLRPTTHCIFLLSARPTLFPIYHLNASNTPQVPVGPAKTDVDRNTNSRTSKIIS